RNWRSALIALDEERYDKAAEHARRCLALRPDAESRRLLAVCQLLRGDWSEAVELGRMAW
ncbi:MAG: tetratricopeptide repeat protein, partial [Isosphaeraceae bacterium]